MAHLQDVTVEWTSPSEAIGYIGDLSRADALLLAHYASTAMRIVEFGAGGSTQILAQAAVPEATIVSLDTNLQWIERTRLLCAKLSITREICYYPYSTWQPQMTGPIDLAFVDGHSQYRLEFARQVWKVLQVGGILLFHDTRRLRDVHNVTRLIEENHCEVGTVLFNHQSSNITVVHKKVAEPYVNWHKVEHALPDKGTVPREGFMANPPVRPAPPTATAEKLLLVVGHPRSGTGFMSRLLQAFGLSIGHERMQEHGISSWMQAGRATAGVWNWSRFGDVLHVVREPLSVISSMAFTVLPKPSVIERMGREIAIPREAGPVEQACHTYLGWNKLIDSRQPRMRVRVEEAPAIIRQFLRERRLLLTPDVAVKLPPANYNTRPHRTLSAAELRCNIPEKLWVELIDYSRDLGYARLAVN